LSQHGAEPAVLVGGALRASISNALVHLHSQYYGKGPTRCRTHYTDDVITVVMENILTTVEHTLHESGHSNRVREVRLSFQEAMAEKFVGTVEDKTGRRVKAFLSAVNVEADTSVEVFTLEPRPEDELAALTGEDGSVDGHIASDHLSADGNGSADGNISANHNGPAPV
jgi:uncharacterized protein YbcI